jgi:hypothetical protein
VLGQRSQRLVAQRRALRRRSPRWLKSVKRRGQSTSS